MHFFTLSTLTSATFFAYAQAAYLNNELSFGHDGKISPNGRAIPNFHMMGQPNYPQILSNRIILTPPVEGNQRAGVWSEKQLQHSEWAADVDFRATGPERAGGNLNIWYAKHEGSKVSSIYTVGKFDGLALVVDQYAGSGGYIRGFLNDGTVDYSTHHSVDSLAFGHCAYSYRNRGLPSKITLRQTPSIFRVEVDGALCFESGNVKLPTGYVFGVTAASAENPDSFEIFKFVVTTENHTPDNGIPQNPDSQQAIFQAASNPPQGQGQNQNQNQNQGQQLNLGQLQQPPVDGGPIEAPASDYKSQDAQFADLHNRLQAMMKHITALNRDFSAYQANALSRIVALNTNINSLTSTVSRLESALSKLESIPAIEKSVRDVQTDLRSNKIQIHETLDRHVDSLKKRVAETHGSVLGTVGESLKGKGEGVGLWTMIFVVLGSQVGLVGVYLWYKKRKNGGTKKYL